MLSPGSLWSETVKGLVCFCAETGSRKSEVSLPEVSSSFDRSRLTRSNLRFVTSTGQRLDDPTRDQLLLMKDGSYVTVRPCASKTDRHGEKWGNHSMYLDYSTTADICTARHLVNMELLNPCRGVMRQHTPLFSLGVSGQHLHHALMDKMLVDLLSFVPASCLGHELRDNLSWHSFRVYLACALKAMQVDDDDICAMCRWSTKEALRIYARWEPSNYIALLRSARSVMSLDSFAVGSEPAVDDNELFAAA